MLASVAVPPADRHASAIRRFPPGCGRRTNATARLPPRYPLQATAAAAPEPPLPNPSLACAANTTAPLQPTRTRPAAAGPGRGVGSGGKAAAAVTARCVSAVRRYPPGCGRDVAAPKPPASASEGQGESGVGKTTAVLCTSYAEARPCDREEFNSNGRCVSAVRRYPPGCGRGVAAPEPPASASEGQGESGVGKTTAVLCNSYAEARPCDREEFNSNGGMQNEGGGDAGAHQGVGGKPWVVTGLMAVPFLPWAQYGSRSQRLPAERLNLL